MKYVLSIFFILLAVYFGIKSELMLEKFYLINRKGLYVPFNSTYHFPFSEIIFSLLFALYGILVLNKRKIVISIIFGVLISFLFFETLINLNYEIHNLFNTLLKFLGLLFLLELFFSYKLLSFLRKNKDIWLRVIFIGLTIIVILSWMQGFSLYYF